MTWPGQVASSAAPGAMLLQASARSLAFNTLVSCLVSLDVGTSYVSTAWDTSLVNIPCTVECLIYQREPPKGLHLIESPCVYVYAALVLSGRYRSLPVTALSGAHPQRVPNAPPALLRQLVTCPILII